MYEKNNFKNWTFNVRHKKGKKKKKKISQNIFTLAIKKEKNKNKNLYIDSSEKMSFWSIYAMSKTQFFKWCTR